MHTFSFCGSTFEMFFINKKGKSCSFLKVAVFSEYKKNYT